MATNWRASSGHVTHRGCEPGTCRGLWRVTRVVPLDERGPFLGGSLEELNKRDGRLWLVQSYETAKRKAASLNAIDFNQERRATLLSPNASRWRR